MFTKNENITLRVAEPYDADIIYRWENDMEIWRVSDTIVPFSRHQIEQFLLNNNDLVSDKQLRLMIVGSINGDVVGCIDLYDYDSFNQRAGIGIMVDKNHRGKGYAKQAIALLMDYCFNTLLLNQLYALVLSSSIDSIVLFESLGFERCGIRKQWCKTPSGFTDQIEYQYINNKK